MKKNESSAIKQANSINQIIDEIPLSVQERINIIRRKQENHSHLHIEDETNFQNQSKSNLRFQLSTLNFSNVFLKQSQMLSPQIIRKNGVLGQSVDYSNEDFS